MGKLNTELIDPNKMHTCNHIFHIENSLHHQNIPFDNYNKDHTHKLFC